MIEPEKLAEEVSQLNMSTTTISTTAVSGRPICGSSFWALIAPLFRGLAHLSDVYAHHGMFQETMYYVEQAHTLVKEVGSEVYMAMVSADLGSRWLRAGVLDKGSEFLMESKRLSSSDNESRNAAILAYHLGTMHGILGDRNAEIAAYDNAEAILERLTETEFIGQLDQLTGPAESLEQGMSKLSLSRRKVPAKAKAAARLKAMTKRKTVVRAKSPPVEVNPSIAVECPQIMSLKATVIRRKAITLASVKDYAEARGFLNETGTYSTTQIDLVEQGLAMARHLLLQSMDQMNADPVYSVLQESTISFPSIVGQSRTDKGTSERLSVAKFSPPRKLPATKGARSGDRSRSPAPGSFIEKLRQAQEHLMDIHPVALSVAPVSVLHSISALLNSVAILLSATGQVKGKPLAHPGFASCSIGKNTIHLLKGYELIALEHVRTLVLRRERKAILADPQTTLKMDDTCWPSWLSTDPKRSSLGITNDMARFQREYIDIIPKDWTAISISLSDSRSELSITKLQAGHSPFVLRLPLGRNNSIDADEEVFGFEQGQSELSEVLRLANESSHDARDLTGREAKTAWWEEREALDARLRDLLENIEKVWLGGFTGIFSQHSRKPDLLARFQKSFQNILDKHLPSRQKTGRRNTSPRVTLDSRILDLFIGLGDASSEECDFSEPLTDLLYFVVDVLQFHGELNAYAEIDFDSIVVETHDALRAYHQAARSSQSVEGRHTILILDKTLHAFPWESLPCMDGMAVSRLPSLGCLRHRILAKKADIPEDGPPGHYASRDNGSYILNPGGDLKSTQTTFQKPLQSLSNWNGIIKREPTEDEMRSDLESKEILLYFGHGSGAQYIRARGIRKLETCAVTVLMGCSSGSLIEAGEFEPYGPPINYMHAGCPALVATLWDVTDKDIDRFAKCTFEHWGLFEGQSETVGKGKGKKKMESLVEEQQFSLVEAVAKGKEACNLRYLTAAAVCVYGIPVYLR
jgi:separase